MRKAQTQAVTLVLISGIVIALAGAAYMWGKPMIEKRTTITQFTSAVRFMDELDDRIVDIARSCVTPGACEESLSLPIAGFINVDPANNTITYEFVVTQPLLTEGEIPLNTGNIGEVAAYGETPGVIMMRGMAKEGVYRLVFTLHYRELYNDRQGRGYRINLEGSGTGTGRILITYSGSETLSNQGWYGGDLILSKMDIQVV
ncbi:MAG: hypothetical protein GTN38_01090 [Candidatus Aenigmarchaeota archaeon]|nr:hypothetical protein [Candidatus Aenigmarchaeota archaeon]NIP40190.1 hypothetical protein [Candidatus Aenigmarchaeota archaeon]NIQ17227.1 hypothetical protein [Candidatus Aenigmarchaeota archaeon]NIS73017.1 hypothetical protein [Candidatus Aenigmarchaeota archaeon]